MSATVEANTSTSWGKRRREEDSPIGKEIKRPRYYYFRLESESSRCSEEDTESVYSVQDKDTDVVQDTPDTESQDSENHDEYEVEIEYEVASLSESDCNALFDSSNSSCSEEATSMMLAAAAAAICDNSLEAWVTDVEDSEDSSLEDSSFRRKVFPKCAQCKGDNNHPLYRYCDKCFQDRKKYFPPRPRRRKKSRKNKKDPTPNNPVKLDTLRNCLSGLSQDSGISSSLDLPPLDLDQIVVPKHLTPGTSKSSNSEENEEQKNSVKNPSAVVPPKNIGKRSRQSSESSLSEFELPSKKAKVVEPSAPNLSGLGSEGSSFASTVTERSESSELYDLCMFCNNAPKDSIFLHKNIAHRCCCYKCAKKTLHTIKRCPICNQPVNKVVKMFTT